MVKNSTTESSKSNLVNENSKKEKKKYPILCPRSERRNIFNTNQLVNLKEIKITRKISEELRHEMIRLKYP